MQTKIYLRDYHTTHAPTFCNWITILINVLRQSYHQFVGFENELLPNYPR